MKDLKIYIIGATTLFTIYIIANLNRPKEVNWVETYSNKDKVPFGTQVAFERITDIFPGSVISQRRKPVYNVIAEDSLKHASYIIICGGIDISRTDYEQLTKYIKAGNDVFIAAASFGSLMAKHLKVEMRSSLALTQRDMGLKFLSPSLDTQKTYTIDKNAAEYYFDKFDTAHAVVIGQNIEHKANFIKFNMGKGNLYLMSTPKMLTNYSLLQPQGAAYAAKALSYIKKTPLMVWDEYYTQGAIGEASPMRVFLTNPALSWAYYISLASILIFVLYEIKRRQRVIPLVKPLSNSTIDFVNVVGQVYYESRDNTNIAQKKTTYFLAYLRDHHKVKTTKLDKEFTELLIKRTGIEQSLAENLTIAFNFVNAYSSISDQELIKLNHLIEQFYIQSR